jgi:pyridoxal phosphate enzyme (YggS family)
VAQVTAFFLEVRARAARWWRKFFFTLAAFRFTLMPMTDIVANLQTLRSQLGHAKLCAVSKGQGAERIKTALQAGQRLFGENRVQEGAEKFPQLRVEFPDLRLHLIGPLQTNKVKPALENFDAIQTIDRPELLQKILRYPELLPGKEFFIQVNIAREPQKSGVLPDAADDLILAAKAALGAALVGLMTIPPQAGDPTPHFLALAALAKKHGLGQLSMGMSGDYMTAIRCGATMVRIGSGVFGSR